MSLDESWLGMRLTTTAAGKTFKDTWNPTYSCASNQPIEWERTTAFCVQDEGSKCGTGGRERVVDGGWSVDRSWCSECYLE